LFKRAGTDLCFKSLDAAVMNITAPPAFDFDEKDPETPFYEDIHDVQSFSGISTLLAPLIFAVDPLAPSATATWNIDASMEGNRLYSVSMMGGTGIHSQTLVLGGFTETVPVTSDPVSLVCDTQLPTPVYFDDSHVITITNSGINTSLGNWFVLCFGPADGPATYSPSSSSSFPQPLWVSNFKVTDSPDGVTVPVQIGWFGHEEPDVHDNQMKVNSGSSGNIQIHAPSEFELMCHRMQRGTDDFLLPGVYKTGSCTMEQYTALYNSATLTQKLGTCCLFYCGSRGYKVVFPTDIAYEVISCALDITKTLPTTSSASLVHSELGICVTDQNTFRMIEFDFPFISQYPCYFCDKRQSLEFTSIVAPIDPLLWATNTADTTPVPEAIYENVGYDFRFYGRLPPSNLLRSYLLSNKKVS